MFVDRRGFLQQAGLVLGGAELKVAHRAVLCQADPVEAVEWIFPQRYRVYQRRGFDPRQAHDHAENGLRRGGADVELVWTSSVQSGSRWRARIVALPDAFGVSSEWIHLEATRTAERWRSKLRVEAGGWYRVELLGLEGDVVVARGAIDPIGVGEVFVVAGQSYAEGANDELLKVLESSGRVTAFDFDTGGWQVAHDPQPSTGTGGTIWPPLGDLLVPLLRVPVGFVNVAVGGTAIRQWQPGEALFDRLLTGARGVEDFRAVLWQQGESDVIERTANEVYSDRLRSLRSAFAAATGNEASWLLALSTMHPTVYNDPRGEARIRQALESLWGEPGFSRGPNTDLLGDENRGGPGTRRHFTGIGQRRAAQLWFVSVWTELQHPRRVPS